MSVTKIKQLLVPTQSVTAIKLRVRHFKVPLGTADNSPAIHCRERAASFCSSPVRDGRNSSISVVPDGTGQGMSDPAMNDTVGKF
ncbi:MAG: hypothetical protein GY749_26895 [Desulfobacteraceae bacterium]|nr:hypothetical protein [Desulfobacteraceae bacterium]